MILRVYNVDWILGWVACLIAFISVFFPSWKTVFKQSRQLLDTSSTPGYLSSFSTSFYHNLDSFSTARWIDRQTFWTLNSFSIAGGSIKLLYYLFCWIVPRQILDGYISRSLLCSTHGSTPLSVEIYWTTIYSFSAIRLSFYSTSLLIYPSFHLPNLSHSLQTSSSRFLQAFSRFYSLGKLLMSHIHTFHVLKPRIWDFWKILGFFKIFKFLLKFWDGF